ncbi:MAG: long-chain-fatty-acid--CoA ligase [Gammaproteobacteria bacterium]|nr:long-chain-fatty-acid--CoA ligase [Gammaproteobacteria bacterium]
MQRVPDMLVNAAKRFGSATCVSNGRRLHSFAETHERAGRLAAALLADGLRAGDRVAILAHNELEYTEIQVACQRAGLILVPMNYRLSQPELAYIVDDCGPRALIHGPGFAATADRLGVERTLHLGAEGTGASYDYVLAAAVDTLGAEALPAATPCSILYTSGTTGRPKGAVLSNLALWARMNSSALEVRPHSSAVFLQCLPLFHIASNLGYAFTYCGATNVFVTQFDLKRVIEHIECDRPSHILLVPTMINMLLNHPDIADVDFSSVEMVLYGASSIAPDVLRRAMAVMGCEFLQLFGMTETSGCTVLRPADHDPVNHPEWLASAGTDAIGFETKVVDDADLEVAAGVVGEVVTRGPAVMTGYWNNDAATAEALRNGWMHTGDLGYRGEDGYVYITDRKKDMIISGGENVYPREVEDVLYAHPAIVEAAVIGVPDPRWGERVHAVVVLRDGQPVEADTLLAFVRERLAGYKVPRSVEFTDELPKNATGKILKKDLRAARSDVTVSAQT